MAINGMQLLMNPTSVAWTGGTATSFETDGTPVATGIHVADMSEADFRLRTHITFKNRNPVLQPDGSWSKGKKDVILTIPREQTDGTIVFDVARVSLEINASTSTADASNLRHLIAQAILDSELDAYYIYGSTN